jgi:2-polyprenyl-3-methyl-5-hydroxy-6-metoxy-1,4-benzoquinol methylase
LKFWTDFGLIVANESDALKLAVSQLPAKIETKDGVVCVSADSADGSLTLEIRPSESSSSIIRQTTFPLELIESLAGELGCVRLSDLVHRYQNPKSVSGVLKAQMLSYFRPEEFQGKRLLDFGCGSGASTWSMAQLFPDTEIVGIDLVPARIEVAKKIAAFQGIKNARFLCSPSGDRLPEQIGHFDFVMLSAVYEHLLPRERTVVMPLLWSVMKEGAAIFINQTPYRYFPFEHHSTGLWFINFVPDGMAHWMARKFAKYDPSTHDPEINKSPNWETHLRGGLRGGTELSMVRDLTSGKKSEARILQPRADCARDRADYWLVRTGPRHRSLKKAIAQLYRVTDKLLGSVPSMNVDVVIRKETGAKASAVA